MSDLNVKVDIRPDWLTMTGRYLDTVTKPIEEPSDSGGAWVALSRLLQAVGQSLYLTLEGFKEANPPAYYRYAFQDKENGVMVAFGGAKQGYLLQLQGTWWSRHTKVRVYMKEDLANQGMSPTRFDWSVTISGDGAFDYLHAEWAFDYMRIVRDGMELKTPRVGMPVARGDMRTTNAGSRESAKYVRIYDKRYWAEDKNEACRLEIEYKKGAVKWAWDCFLFDPDRLTADMLNYCFQDPEHWPPHFVELFEVRQDNIPSTMPKEPSNRDKWFNDVVRKSFKLWAIEEPIHARQWIANALHQWTDLYTIADEQWKDEPDREE